MNEQTGGPMSPDWPESAFPSTLTGQVHRWGMTLRDYFAAAAMQGFISNPNVDWGFDDAAKAAYAQADAMIEARDK